MKRKINVLYGKMETYLSKIKDLPLLFLRLILAYGFYGPAVMKWRDIHGVGKWFASMHYPLPYFSAYLAGITEITGVVLLTLGLLTRLISIPLMFTMLVAIFTVHFDNGFKAGNNGFEIPLYYLLMLFTLFVLGPGKISLDNLIRKKSQEQEIGL